MLDNAFLNILAPYQNLNNTSKLHFKFKVNNFAILSDLLKGKV